jgi:hypothetical protein
MTATPDLTTPAEKISGLMSGSLSLIKKTAMAFSVPGSRGTGSDGGDGSLPMANAGEWPVAEGW